MKMDNLYCNIENAKLGLQSRNAVGAPDGREAQQWYRVERCWNCDGAVRTRRAQSLVKWISRLNGIFN